MVMRVSPCVCLLLAVASLPRAVAEEARWLAPPRTGTPPLVDGLLDDPCWGAAARTTPFVSAAGTEADPATTALVCYDDACLYVAFDCPDPDPSRLVAEAARRDGAVGGDDSVGLLLYPGYQDGPAFCFVVSARGTQRDARNGDVAWDGQWESATGRTPRGWTVEIRLPLACLDPGWSWPRHWLAQLWRYTPRTGELSSWAAGLGMLQNLDVDWSRFCVRAVTVDLRPGETHLALRNEGLGDIGGTLIVETEAPSGATTRQVIPATLRGGQVALFDIVHALSAPEPYRVWARFDDDAGPRWMLEPREVGARP